jgi:hypothetical protein
LARTDDYANALRLAAQELGGKDPRLVADLSGATYDETRNVLTIDFLGRLHEVPLPSGEVRYAGSDEEPPLTERVLILRYLNQANGAPVKNEPITYRELPSGEFYYSAFSRRAEIPMLKAFGEHPERLNQLAPEIGGRPLEGEADGAAVFHPLPRVPITLLVWGGDDEFEPAGKILFDKSAQHYLTLEDASWTASFVVYRLMKLAFAS